MSAMTPMKCFRINVEKLEISIEDFSGRIEPCCRAANVNQFYWLLSILENYHNRPSFPIGE